MKNNIFTLFFVFLASFSVFAQSDDFIKGTVYVKWKEAYRLSNSGANTNHPAIQQVFQQLAIERCERSFPNTSKPSKEFDQFGRKLEDLSLINNLYFPENKNVKAIVQHLLKSGLVEWAEPRYRVKPFFTPNDPMLTDLYHLGVIKAYEAWDITQGDTNLTIGIVDAGIQFDHPDLLANIKYNYADPVNGIDDDGNGYIDDWRGWNPAGNSNNPTATLSPHGLFSSGISSATVNNNLGVAGVGYKTKFLTVRIDNNQGWSFGYEGIVYAAEMNCTVINCSWGNNTFSQLSQSVINYATINKNCLIVAAAGNSNNEVKVYPATYEGVISVGGTMANDDKWGNSTFNYAVDIVAPSNLLKSTFAFNGYDVSSGTSFAAPMVSAAAALVKTQFPTYNARQLGERLKVTADTILYSNPANANFQNKLGAGRLNILKALTDPNKPSVYLENQLFTDNNDQFLQPGDTVTLSGDWMNYLSASSAGLMVEVSSLSPFIEILTTNINIGVLPTLTALTANQPIKFVLLQGMPFNADLAIKLTFNDLNYKGFQVIEQRYNKDYIDLSNGFLTTTITSKGAIGFNANNANDGKGIQTPNDNRLIFYGGLMLGKSTTQVSNNTYGATLPNYDNDFVRLSPVEKVIDDNKSTVLCEFDDSGAAANAIGLKVKQKSIAINQTDQQNFLILDYTVINQTENAIPTLASGLYMDWEVGVNEDQNMATFDPISKMTYAYNPNENNRFIGVKLLSAQSANGYCFNGNGTGGSVNYYDGFSKTEKYNTLASVVQRNQTILGDVASTLSFNSTDLAANDSIQFTYAIITGEDLASLNQAGNQALAFYWASLNQFSFVSNASGCANNEGNLTVNAQADMVKKLSVFDSNQTLIAELDSFIYDFELSNLASGQYRIEIAFNDSVSISQIISVESTPNVEVTIDNLITTIDLASPQLSLTASSNNASQYTWFVDNLEVGTEPTLNYNFTNIGSYTISVEATNGVCADTLSFLIQVTDSTIGINQLTEKTFSLFPNPTQDFVQIQSNRLIKTIQIYDIQGKLMMHFAPNQTTHHWIDVSSFNTGIYQVIITDEFNHRISKRFEKVK